jgi:hypothetical protein
MSMTISARYDRGLSMMCFEDESIQKPKGELYLRSRVVTVRQSSPGVRFASADKRQYRGEGAESQERRGKT